MIIEIPDAVLPELVKSLRSGDVDRVAPTVGQDLGGLSDNDAIIQFIGDALYQAIDTHRQAETRREQMKRLQRSTDDTGLPDPLLLRVKSWVQPKEAGDGYSLGLKIEHNGSVYESTVEDNWEEPGTGDQWTFVEAVPAPEPEPEPTEWDKAVTYATGEKVTYKGLVFTSLVDGNKDLKPDENPASWEQQ